MTWLFLHFWNVSATFRIWQKNPYLKYVSSPVQARSQVLMFGGAEYIFNSLAAGLRYIRTLISA